MISGELLALLRCPETRQPLAHASADIIAHLESERVAGRLLDRSGNEVIEPIAEGLVCADSKRFFRIRAGIPVLIAAEAIGLPPS